MNGALVGIGHHAAPQISHLPGRGEQGEVEVGPSVGPRAVSADGL